jgi:uncharacterized OsmC-like protein
MRVELHGENDLTLLAFAEPGFHVEVHDPEGSYSALEMFATSLGLCTASVLIGWAGHHDLVADELEVRVRWRYADDPFRVGAIEMDVHWPGVPERLRESARKAAEHCTLHHTLHEPPEVVTRLHGDDVRLGHGQQHGST